MRLLFTIIILVFQLIAFGQQEIDFDHKKINKFIKKTYSIDEFTLAELPDNSLNGKLFSVNDMGDSRIDRLALVYIGRVNSCRSGGCSIDHTLADDSFEYFDYIIAFNTDMQIINMKIYNYQATHGQEITAKSWLRQFRYKPNQDVFHVNKNIDAISGATISVYAITDDVNRIIDYLKSRSTEIVEK